MDSDDIVLRRLERDSHERCSQCGRLFTRGDNAHSGFLGDGSAAFVGDCCAGKLVRTAHKRYWFPLSFEMPPSDAVLWRYMDLAKFIALLKDQSLYFARSDLLGDPFEGAKGSQRRRADWDSFYLESFREAVRNPPPGVDISLSSEEVEAEAQRLLREMEAGGSARRRMTYVSCWHESDHESDALWARYGGDGSGAVAIRTTAGQLNEALGDDPGIHIGRVQYLDFSREFAGPNDAFFRKRRSFRHEREVRALIDRFDPHAPKPGHLVPIDVSVLIDSVVVSPIAPAWFSDVVREVGTRFRLEVEPVHSQLSDEPFF